MVGRDGVEISKFFTNYGCCELIRFVSKTKRWRYYSIAILPGLFATILQRQWCRQGFKPRIKEDEYEDLDEAMRIANLIYRAKTRIGYREYDRSSNLKGVPHEQ